MKDGFHEDALADISAVLTAYLDALHDGDADGLAEVFHPASHLYAVVDGTLEDRPRDVWLDQVRSRPTPRAQGLSRHDRIVQIHRAGPDTALAVVNCAIPPKYFTDYLMLLRVDGGWRIVSKGFHADVHGD